MAKDFNERKFNQRALQLVMAGYPAALAQLAALRYLQAPAGELTDECRGFHWGRTPEGYDFWRGVYLDWRRRNFRPTHPQPTQRPQPATLTVQITLEGFTQ